MKEPTYGQFFTTLHMPDASAERCRAYSDLLRLTTSPANAVALLRVFFEADVLEAAPRIRSPTLVLHAREDPIIPFDEGRLVASLIPGARFVPLESRNPILQETEPAWQPFVDALEEFLPTPAAQVGRFAEHAAWGPHGARASGSRAHRAGTRQRYNRLRGSGSASGPPAITSR